MDREGDDIRSPLIQRGSIGSAQIDLNVGEGARSSYKSQLTDGDVTPIDQKSNDIEQN